MRGKTHHQMLTPEEHEEGNKWKYMGKNNSDCGIEQESIEQKELEMGINGRTAGENQRESSTLF